MNGEARWVAVVVAFALASGLLIAAWNGYRAAAWLLLIDALPLCG
ncbi:hypothetical protein [Hyphomicrobium sp.]|nr:hypothetical protein [Hyphomicrobium sp.]